MGIGTLVLGAFTTWAEASTGMHDFLARVERVGPLSGSVGFAPPALVVSWAMLGVMWKDENRGVRRSIATVVLLAVGFVPAFPTLFQAFA